MSFTNAGGAPVEPGCNLFVAGLPPGTGDARLRELFAPFGNIVSAKVMVDLKTKQLRSHGFVLYDAPEAAMAALHAMHKRKLDDGNPGIHVAFATHSDSDRSVECEVVYIRNLPDTVTVEHLRQVFARFGNIVDVTLPVFTQPGHQGVGFVRFSSIDEAREAVNRAHNTTPFGGGRAVQVRFKESRQMSQRRGQPGGPSSPGSGSSSPFAMGIASSPHDTPLLLGGSLAGSPHNVSLTGPPKFNPTSQISPSSGFLLMPVGPVPAPLPPSPHPPTPKPFPATNDLFFTSFMTQEWLLHDVLGPWAPTLVQPRPDGIVVRLRDETLHVLAAQSLHGIVAPNGQPLTAAMLRISESFGPA